MGDKVNPPLHVQMSEVHFIAWLTHDGDLELRVPEGASRLGVADALRTAADMIELDEEL